MIKVEWQLHTWPQNIVASCALTNEKRFKYNWSYNGWKRLHQSITKFEYEEKTNRLQIAGDKRKRTSWTKRRWNDKKLRTEDFLPSQPDRLDLCWTNGIAIREKCDYRETPANYIWNVHTRAKHSANRCAVSLQCVSSVYEIGCHKIQYAPWFSYHLPSLPPLSALPFLIPIDSDSVWDFMFCCCIYLIHFSCVLYTKKKIQSHFIK